MRSAFYFVIFFSLATIHLHAQTDATNDIRLDSSNLSVTLPAIVMQDIATPVTFKITDPAIRSMVHGNVAVIIDGKEIVANFI